MKDEISTITKYLKKKYPKRYILKLEQVAKEFKMEKEQIKTLRKDKLLKSFSTKAIATFIVENPPRHTNSCLV